MTIAGLRRSALRQVDPASAAVFRIGLGLVGMWLVWRFFAKGWIETLFVEPSYHFTYPGFDWVQPWPGWGMYAHFAIMGLAALGIVLGWRTRWCAALFAVMLAYVELIDRTLYLNHYYWAILSAGLIAFLPVDRAFAIRPERGGPIPIWVIWLLRFQVGMVYFFAGLAKVNADWLLRGEPLATWLPARSWLPLIGPLLTLPVAAIAMSWLGAFFDLTVVGWLSWRRSRPYAFAALVVFHGLTWLLFPSIGVFPLLMIVSATVYFAPSWPRRFLPRKVRVDPEQSESRPRLVRGWLVLAAVYVTVMIALPLRHYVIPGDVKWTGEGYLGSWQVMLTEKSGSATFVVTDPDTGESWNVPPPEYLTGRQVAVMATDPVMIRQTAALIARDLAGQVEVGADVMVSLNGRPSAQFTDPEVDLARQLPQDPARQWLVASPVE